MKKNLFRFGSALFAGLLTFGMYVHASVRTFPKMTDNKDGTFTWTFYGGPGLATNYPHEIDCQGSPDVICKSVVTKPLIGGRSNDVVKSGSDIALFIHSDAANPTKGIGYTHVVIEDDVTAKSESFPRFTISATSTTYFNYDEWKTAIAAGK